MILHIFENKPHERLQYLSLALQHMAKGYGEVDGKTENPLILKTQFIMSLCEQVMKPDRVGAHEKSIIGRCVANVYRDYMKNYVGEPPTLKNLREELLRQPEP